MPINIPNFYTNFKIRFVAASLSFDRRAPLLQLRKPPAQFVFFAINYFYFFLDKAIDTCYIIYKK